MMNRYMTEVNNFYRPVTFEAIMFNEPQKARLLETYFEKQREYLKSSSIPTVNLTFGIISPRSTHIARPGWTGITGEYLAIKKSCESGEPVYTYGKSYYSEISGCRFAYAADLPISILTELMEKNKENLRVIDQYAEFYKKRKESIDTKKLMEELKEENEKLKKQISDIKSNIKTPLEKLIEIASL